MEHRWGERVAVRMTVELYSGSSPPVAGCLENVSSSGAFVRTQGRGPPRGPVAVLLRQVGFSHGRSARVAAYVVREIEGGVGVEWCNFAPRAVRELMIHSPDPDRDRGRARSARPARYSSHETNTVMSPCAQAGAEPSAINARN
jgi:hypothetical protein